MFLFVACLESLVLNVRVHTLGLTEIHKCSFSRNCEAIKNSCAPKKCTRIMKGSSSIQFFRNHFMGTLVGLSAWLFPPNVTESTSMWRDLSSPQSIKVCRFVSASSAIHYMLFENSNWKWVSRKNVGCSCEPLNEYYLPANFHLNWTLSMALCLMEEILHLPVFMHGGTRSLIKW